MSGYNATKIIFIWILVVLISHSLHSNPLVKVDSSLVKISIPERSEYISDIEGLWFKHGLEACVNLSGFKPYNRNAFVYRDFAGPAIVRFRLDVESSTAEDFILELRNTEIDRAQLLMVDQKGQTWKSKMIGDAFPFDERYLDYRTLVFPVKLEAGKSYTCYLGLEKKNRILSTIIELFPKDEWESQSTILNFIYGLAFGLFIMVIIIAFSMLLIMQQRLFLYYGLYVISMLLLLSCFHGFSYQFLFPTKTDLQQYFMLVIQYMALIFGNLYAFQFLGFRHHDKFIGPIRIALVSIYSLGILNTIFHLSLSENFEKGLNLFFITTEILNTILLAGLSIWYIIRHKSEESLVFLISFIFVGLSVFYTNLSFVVESMTYIPIGYSLLAGLAIEMIILTLYMILQYKNTENKRIVAENRFVQEKVKNQSAFINGQEMEKRKMAIDLHDNIGSSLLSLKQRVAPLSEGEELSVAVSKISEDIRNISHELLPTTLEQLGLAAATKELINRNNSLSFHFQEITPTIPLNPNVAIQLYRIIQELIKNTYQHAEAKNVYIQFRSDLDSFELTYEDDGNGFETDHVLNGVGMRSMQTRAQLINGKLSLESTTGEGMVAIITVNI